MREISNLEESRGEESVKKRNVTSKIRRAGRGPQEKKIVREG